jgi:hypothetical protein
MRLRVLSSKSKKPCSSVNLKNGETFCCSSVSALRLATIQGETFPTTVPLQHIIVFWNMVINILNRVLLWTKIILGWCCKTLNYRKTYICIGMRCVYATYRTHRAWPNSDLAGASASQSSSVLVRFFFVNVELSIDAGS